MKYLKINCFLDWFWYLLACKCQNIVSNFLKISCLAFLVSEEGKQVKLIVCILDFGKNSLLKSRKLLEKKRH